MDVKARAFCRLCPQCQCTEPWKPPPAPLNSLPIFSIPYERIGMDQARPLPKSAQGHEYILVILDYVTRYPEVVPLRKATS